MSEPVKVTILDREFLIAAPVGEKSSLLRSAAYLDDKMREIRDRGKVIGLDRIAVMAAINIAHELLSSKQEGSIADSNELRERLQALNKQLAAGGR